jgi:hypothetical protein
MCLNLTDHIQTAASIPTVLISYYSGKKQNKTSFIIYFMMPAATLQNLTPTKNQSLPLWPIIQKHETGRNSTQQKRKQM